MSYKRNANDNRDALFGGGGGGGTSTSNRKKSSNTNNPSSSRQAMPSKYSSSSKSTTSSTTTSSTKASSSSYSLSSYRKQKNKKMSSSPAAALTGAAKLSKMKEAEEYRLKAKKAMARGVFSSPDPLAAATYYKRAADAYKICGENRLERLHRIASGDCQMGQDAYATAASEYTRAAELTGTSSDEPLERKRVEMNKLYNNAAEAWRQMNDLGRAGQAMMDAAMAWLYTDDDDDDEEEDEYGFASEQSSNKKLLSMDGKALSAMEQAVEAHVPDPLNRYASFRQTGQSIYFDPTASTDDGAHREMMDMCRNNLVLSPYAHESVQRAVITLVRYGEYPSALYAIGAVSAIFENDSVVQSTISLHRAYVTETIVALALGDVVTANKFFMDVHLQRNSYLQSRECKLAEEIIRAVQSMDLEELEEVRSPDGSNKAAISHLDLPLRGLIMDLKVSGTAGITSKKKNKNKTMPIVSSNPTPGRTPSIQSQRDEPEVSGKDGDLDGDELQAALNSNYAEMEELMDGLDFDDDDEEEEEEDDDDDIDLR